MKGKIKKNNNKIVNLTYAVKQGIHLTSIVLVLNMSHPLKHNKTDSHLQSALKYDFDSM